MQASLLVACAIGLMARAPSASTPTDDLSPISQAEFLDSLKVANGSVLLKGADISSESVVKALVTINGRKANMLVLVPCEGLGNTDSKIDLVASKFKGDLVSSVFVATSDTTPTPFALIGTRAFYGSELLKEGETIRAQLPQTRPDTQIDEQHLLHRCRSSTLLAVIGFNR